MEISVVVPAYNARKTLPQCLESVVNLKYPGNKFEIVVVDNGSTDGSDEIIKKYPVRYVF